MFFDLITDKNYRNTNFGLFVYTVIVELKREFGFSDVIFFTYNNWKETFQLLQATRKDIEGIKTELTIEEWNEYVYEQNPIHNGIINGSNLLLRQKDSSLLIAPFENEVSDQSPHFGLLVFLINESKKYEESSLTAILPMIAKETYKLFESMRYVSGAIYEEERYEQLYRVTAKFHSSMDMDDVLREIIYTLREVYPSFEYYLLLSHDNSSHSGELPVKDLQYGGDKVNKAAAQAYLTGIIQFEDAIQNKKSVLYAPLKGKQGVYGVLQVLAPNTVMFPKQEVGFIELLANTAGSALENAQLYLQSKRLIADLQLINKTSHRLNSNLRLSEMIKFMSNQITTSFNAQEVAFLIFINDETYKVLPGGSLFFEDPEAATFLSYIHDTIKKEKDALFIGDMRLDSDIPQTAFRSLMAVPMIQQDILKGAVIVLHKDYYHFSFENFKLLQSLIHHSTLAFTNSMLREELEKMVITDHLTKLYSRNFLDEKIQNSMQEDEKGSFLLIDIDNFKKVNDTYGHQTGDNVIVQVADTIRSNIREHDIGARWGGEELAVYLPKVNVDTGVQVANRLVEKVSDNTTPRITISCGVAYWSNDKEDSVKKLFNRADEALYIAKKSGKNMVVVQEEHIV